MKRRDALTGLAGLGITSFTGCLRLSQESGDDTTTDPSTEPNNTTAEQTPNTPPTPDTTPTENETPTPTEEETPTPTEEETATPTEKETPTESNKPSYPLGLSDTGPSPLLFDNHRRTLSETGFKTQWSKVDQTISQTHRQRSYRADQRGVRGEWERQDGSSVAIYRTSIDAYWRENIDGGYTYGNDNHTGRLEEPLWENEITPLIRAGNWNSPTIIKEKPTTVWEVQAEELGTEGVEIWGGTVSSIDSVTATINEDGVIRQLDAEYVLANISHREGKVEFESAYSIESLGDISVDEPDWLSTAEENAPTVSASVTDDQQYLTLELDSGNPLEPGTVITGWNKENSESVINLRLDEPLEPGTTAYIWQYRGPKHFPSGKISRERRPDDASPIELTSEYDIWARRRERQYFTMEDL